MKKILIIETEYVGHYLTGYIKYILRSLNKKKIKIFLLLSDETLQKGKGALKILKDENVKFQIETLKTIKVYNYNFISLFLYQLKLYFLIKKKFQILSNKIIFDHVILTSIQRVDKIISILGSPFGIIKFSGIFLGLKFHLKMFKIDSQSTNNFLSKYLFYRLLKINTLTKIITNDYLLKKFVKKKRWKNENKVLFLHDPKEFNYKFTKKNALTKLGIDKKKFIILVYGAIIDSKGVEELLNIYKLKKPNIHCLIVGKQYGSTKNFLKNSNLVKSLIKKKKISIYDGWQTEIKESIFFNASDAVWIGYKNYSFPSGVLYQAVCLKKPTILSKEGFINELNKKFRIGISCDIKNPDDILNAVNKIKNKKYSQKLDKNISKFIVWSNPHIWTKKFKKFILNIV